MKFKLSKYLGLLLFMMSFNLLQSQNINITTCDTLQTQKAKNACVFKVYNESQNKLDKSFKIILSKLDAKIKKLKPESRTKTISLKQFFKDNQVQWILTRNYNAKVHASYQLTTLQSEYAFYASKAKESLDRINYFKMVVDSLNLN